MSANQRQLKSPENTDWSAPADQQLWFDRFKSPAANEEVVSGIKFSRFRDFLEATIYTYFEQITLSSRRAQQAANNNNDTISTTITRFTYQQEMQLFKVFDSKNDHLIDRDEFANLCQNWLEKTYHRTCALVVVDVQNDFIDGSLALINGPAGQDGSQVVPVINQMLERCKFDAVVYTQDWHPPDHIGFHDNIHLRKYTPKQAASNIKRVSGSSVSGSSDQVAASQISANRDQLAATDEKENGESEKSRNFRLKKLATQVKVFDTVLFEEGRMEQKLWPIHCVRSSWGAELHPKLKIVPKAIRIFKGTLSNVDAYSAFWDNMRLNETGLRQELNSRKITDVFFCGLALDYCVAASAIDSAKAGFTTFVVEDACRGLDEDEIQKRKDEMQEYGVLIVNTNTINKYLAIGTRRDDSRRLEEASLSNKLAQNKLDSALGTNVRLDENGPSSLSTTDGLNEIMLVKNICFKRALSINTSF